MSTLRYPTPTHAEAAEAIVAFFGAAPETAAVLLVNSIARGRGEPGSDLDIAVLTAPGVAPAAAAALDTRWRAHAADHPALRRLRALGRFTGVHLDLFDGTFTPEVWDDGGGPDGFELEIGNRLAYGVALLERGPRLAELRAAWLPFYGEELRAQRLAMVASACRYDLEHVPFYVGRGLSFQAFDRLYKAFQEFLQALCISRRTYPIAYNKWVRELVAERLGLPDLYAQLPGLLALPSLEGDAVAGRARQLEQLVAEHVA